jgi:alpha-beta hydrolase superfamily lysophospholipase
MTFGRRLFWAHRFLILISFYSFSEASLAADEAALEASWDQLIDVPWQTCQAGGFFDDLTPSRKVAYRRCGNNRAGRPVLIIPGYTEPAMKYMEIVGDLSAKIPELGPWYLLDLPGQGASERLVDLRVVDRRVVHVDNPDRYPVAVLGMIHKVIKPENSGSLPQVIAHSTGALVFMSALQRSMDIAGKVVMTAPLIRPKSLFPNFFVSLMAIIHCQFGFCETTAWGRQTLPIEAKTFESNISTTSRARWFAAHKIGLRYPDYYVSGTSWGWLKMAMTLGSEISTSQNPMSPGTLIFMAEDDGYIDPKPSLEACERSRGCEAVTLKGSRHEILHEIDSIRNQALEKIIKHLKSDI